MCSSDLRTRRVLGVDRSLDRERIGVDRSDFRRVLGVDRSLDRLKCVDVKWIRAWLRRLRRAWIVVRRCGWFRLARCVDRSSEGLTEQCVCERLVRVREGRKRFEVKITTEINFSRFWLIFQSN